MWIYVPETYCQSALESEDSISASTWRAKTLEQFVMWREKPSLSRHWLKRWKQGGWIKRLFGRISEPSTARLGVESWIRSLAESRASLIPSPDFSAERTTSETSGPTPQESLPISSPVESSWKTFQALWAISTNELGQTYEQWVTQQRRDYFRRLRSAQAINGSDSSSWPTPRAADWKLDVDPEKSVERMEHRAAKGQVTGGTRNLGMESKMWPTATADNTSSRSKRYAQGGEPLTMATGMWPTPSSHGSQGEISEDLERRGAKLYNNQTSRMLQTNLATETRMWRTPSSSDGEGGVIQPQEGKDMTAMIHYKLRDDAAMWPTPTSSVAGEALNDEMDIYTLSSGNLRKRAKSGQTGSIGLSRVAALQSPSSLHSETTQTDGHVCSPKCRKLNPLFVELHMGVPMFFSSMKTGSIDSDRWETWLSLSRERLRSLLSAEGSKNEHYLS